MHGRLEAGQSPWLCMMGGRVPVGELCTHSVSSSSDLISTVLPVQAGKMRDVCTCHSDTQTCYYGNLLGEGRPQPEREYPSAAVPLHTIPARQASVGIGPQGGEGKEPGQVGGYR